MDSKIYSFNLQRKTWKHHHPHRHWLSSKHASAIRVPITGVIEKKNKRKKKDDGITKRKSLDVNIIDFVKKSNSTT